MKKKVDPNNPLLTKTGTLLFSCVSCCIHEDSHNEEECFNSSA